MVFLKTVIHGTWKPLGGAQSLMMSDFWTQLKINSVGGRAGIINSWGLAPAPSWLCPSRLSGSCTPGGLSLANVVRWPGVHLLHTVAKVPLLTSNQLSPCPQCPQGHRRPSGVTVARKHASGNLGQANSHLSRRNSGSSNMPGQALQGECPHGSLGLYSLRIFLLEVSSRGNPGSGCWSSHQNQ